MKVIYLKSLTDTLTTQGRAFDVSKDPRDGTGHITWTWSDEDGVIHQSRAKFNLATQITDIRDIR